MSTSLFSKTPVVTVFDNRGLTVRDINYHRDPGSPDVTSERITRHHYDICGFPAHSADPLLHNAGQVNFSYFTNLTGNVLRTRGADNGITVVLHDIAGRPIITVSNIRTDGDGKEDRGEAVTRTWQYEDENLAGRPLSITEQVTGKAARITERFVYAGNSDDEKELNLVGTCVSHYDTAGLEQTDSIALTGVPLSVTRRLLEDADKPDTMADWQGQDASVWNNMLDGEAYTTQTTANATGAMLTTTDAKGNMQRIAYDVAGLLSGSWLTLKGSPEQAIVVSLTYSAAGQKLCEEHGNGVVTTYKYEAETQRLTGIKTERSARHGSGVKILQDLRYDYDPVGNVLKITNDAEETRFWRNQKVVPENTCTYDSLYQLVSATGREMANAGQQGCSLPPVTVPLPSDNSAYTNYTRTYTYDDAGNLTQIRHSALRTNNNYTTSITISDSSNRGVLSTLTANPADVDALFTAGGQQKKMQPGQDLVWTPRNELRKVTPVVREGDTDNSESYRYDAGSQRILKISVQKTGNSIQTQRVMYLPGLELRSTVSGDTETENLQVITVGEAGRAQVRVLFRENGTSADFSNGRIRYSYDNLAGGSGLELDGNADIISMEEYYPYGGTAIWTARNKAEANDKTIRYSGKERDASGLYYYGYRYYQPWAGRWLSSDPEGAVDGMNLFRMVRNNPVTITDPDGRNPDFTPEGRKNEVLQTMTPGQLNDSYQRDIVMNVDNEIAAGNALAKKMRSKYVEAIKNYTAGDSNTINAYLRGDPGVKKPLNDIHKKIKTLDKALNKMPKTEGSFLRAVPDSGIGEKLASGVLKAGDRLGDHAYVSTTSSLSALKTQQFYQMHEQVIVYDIHSDMGTSLPFRPFTSVSMPQREVLLPKNGQYEIINFTSFSEDNYRGGTRAVTYIRLKNVPHDSEMTTYGMSGGERNKTSNDLMSLTSSGASARGSRFFRRFSCVSRK